MKKLKLICSLVLIFTVCFLPAEPKKPEKEKAKNQKLKFIEPTIHNLQINCIDFDGSIYFIDNFTLSKKDVQTGKICFLLNSDFIYSEILANGKLLYLLSHTTNGPYDFEPDLGQKLYTRILATCYVYEIAFDKITDLPDTIDICFKYHLKTPRKAAMFKPQNDILQMNGMDFWYPRHPLKDTNLYLTVKTTDVMSFSLNGKAVNYSMLDKYTKEYIVNIKDAYAAPATIIFRQKAKVAQPGEQLIRNQ